MLMDFPDDDNPKEQSASELLQSLVTSDEIEAEEAERKVEFVARIKAFLNEKYKKEVAEAALAEKPLVVDYAVLDKFSPELAELLLKSPKLFFEAAEEAVEELDLAAETEHKVKVRVTSLPAPVNIRDLRARHIGRFISIEGVVRKGSEIRPEVIDVTWECPKCNKLIVQKRRGTFITRPFECDCRNKFGFKEVGKTMIDTRWVVIEEPFELTEGERPSQVTILLKEDLVNQEGRRLSDPGNRLKITGILKDIPKGKVFSVKLDFYLDANYVEATEIGWHMVKISKEDEEEIKKMAKDGAIYETMIDSLAPSLYGMREIKEAIVLQMFGGMTHIMRDKARFRGEIHVLLVGDPASGKSQLMKLVPQIMPRGKYVSGKGTTAAGLTASVSKDEQFMGGWVLEAGAMVLAHKGLLAVDEFEKMSEEDQVAMHEGLEQGSISIAKASIVATLPAQTSVLAGGNPKFSRFDPYLPINKQITIPETLLTRFDLKFVLKDLPDADADKRVVDHILASREVDYEGAKPKLSSDFIRKYVAYAKEKCKPVMSKETGDMIKRFYVEMRRKAQKEGGPIPITLRQFEALLRLSEASAKMQLSDVVRKEDAKRAIRLMKYSLRQLGYDPETGAIDVDKAEGGTPAKERSDIRMVLDVVENLSKKKKEMMVSDILEQAKKDGVDRPEEIVERLKREGLLFEPSPGYVQKV
ncbi:MAG: minichromosome maintenance protein MCM [Candidatus Aenigmarchaeota archaeon]|nr:minichromosome maintenance protein MCM [Candidatus Aenigmarchaeota archaeon]